MEHGGILHLLFEVRAREVGKSYKIRILHNYVALMLSRLPSIQD